MNLEPGDVVALSTTAPHAPSKWRGQEVEVLDVRIFGTPRESWAWCERDDRRMWIPTRRLRKP